MRSKLVVIFAIFTLLFIALPAAPAAAAVPTNGVECGCSKTGPYVDPDPGTAATASASGMSPGGVYRVTASGTGPIDLQVVRVSDNSIRLSTNIPITGAQWGFSPDDDRFLYQYTTGTSPNQIHNVVLYDLVARVTRWQSAVNTGAARVVFSPHGNYLMYAAVTAANHTELSLVDARSNQPPRYSAGFNFTSPPGTPGDSFGVAHFGWSPDDNDRTFVYGFITGQSSAVWTLVNQAATSNRQVSSQQLTSIAAFWQFSPCGEIIALVTQPSGNQANVQLLRTVDGTTAANQLFTGLNIQLSTNATNHVATVNGTPTNLATNAAAAACATPGGTTPVSLTAVSVNPTLVQGGTSSSGRVTLSGNAPPGGVAVLLSSNDPAATVPASVNVPGGSSSAQFTVATTAVTTTHNATITARQGTTTRTATLTVQPAPPPVSGNAMRAGFNSGNFPGNDDGSMGPLAIGFPINYFGTTFSNLFLNNNGNVTFDSPLGTFTPFPLQTTNRVIIAPFFADVDTRVGNTTRFGNGVVDGHQAWGATWPGVGCFSVITSVLNDFQVILIDRSDTGAGNFDIEFNYNRIQWETGTASGGNSACRGGSPARVGFSNGSTNSFELPGSGTTGFFLDSSATGLIRNSLNTLQQGRYVFAVRNGAAPTGATIDGDVFLNGTAPANLLPNALVSLCGTNGSCNLTQTNGLGHYAVGGLSPSSYTVRATPGAATNAVTGQVGPIAVSGSQHVTAPPIVLTGPTPPPPGTTITSRSVNANGLPVIYYRDTLTLTTRACAGGTATYAITLNTSGAVIRSGPMAESSPGVYTATIAPLFPDHGYARVSIQITCPSGPPVSTTFDIYIDPSGVVRTPGGTPLEGVLVTLYRSDNAGGPFEVVPDGSAIMSIANRTNPDLTNFAGLFGWDVIPGFYRVRAERADCHAPGNVSALFVETALLTIPPAVTDLDLRLDCGTTVPGSLNLNGTGYAEVADNGGLNLTGDWTVEAWFRDEDPDGFNHDARQIINKGDRSSSPESPYFVLISHNHLLAGVRTNGVDYPIDIDLNYRGFDPAAWHHVAVHFRADMNVLNLWIDGVHQGYRIVPTHSLEGNDLPVQIGRNGPTSGKYWIGMIDDVRIWNVVRKGTDITPNFATEFSETQAGLVANWKFNDGEGATTATDSAGGRTASLRGDASITIVIHP